MAIFEVWQQFNDIRDAHLIVCALVTADHEHIAYTTRFRQTHVATMDTDGFVIREADIAVHASFVCPD